MAICYSVESKLAWFQCMGSALCPLSIYLFMLLMSVIWMIHCIVSWINASQLIKSAPRLNLVSFLEKQLSCEEPLRTSVPHTGFQKSGEAGVPDIHKEGSHELRSRKITHTNSRCRFSLRRSVINGDEPQVPSTRCHCAIHFLFASVEKSFPSRKDLVIQILFHWE